MGLACVASNGEEREKDKGEVLVIAAGQHPEPREVGEYGVNVPACLELLGSRFRRSRPSSPCRRDRGVSQTCVNVFGSASVTPCSTSRITFEAPWDKPVAIVGAQTWSIRRMLRNSALSGIYSGRDLGERKLP